MICPKCKRQIPEKTLKCNYCGAKIATLCKSCRAYNSIYNLNCVKCSRPLLKICPSCKSVNFPEASTCRKCEYDFANKDIAKNLSNAEEENFNVQNPNSGQEAEIASKQDIEEKNEKISEEMVETNEDSTVEPLNNSMPSLEQYSQQKAKDILVAGILSPDRKVISVCGEKGVGKTVVLKTAINQLSEHEITWLLGECSAVTQISPCGLIQNLLLTFFNIPPFCSDSLKLKKESQKFFQSEFPSLTNDEIFNLLNFLYPTSTDYFENILKNKEKTFVMLKKVFKTITETNKTVIIIENFEQIDGFSYEFLHKLINDDFKEKNTKFLLTYSDIRPVRGYLYGEKFVSAAYLDIALKNFDKKQVNTFVSQFFTEEKCPEDIIEKLYKISGGNSAILEQYVSLLIDYKKINNSFNIELPNSFNDLLKTRLELLKENIVASRILVLGAIQGISFSHAIIGQVMNIEDNILIENLNLLQQLNFIMQTSEFSFAFKNSMLWSTIFDLLKDAELFRGLSTNLFSVCSNFTLSTNSILAVIAQNLNENLSALNIWTENIKLASFVGDTNLYAISQKQSLMLVDKLDHEYTSLIKNNIYERLGKLLTKTNPTEAIEYLPSAIANARNLENNLKEIELTGYLADCCISLGDYYGTIECVDSVINKLDESFDLEIAVLKSRKLGALINIGNCGEIVNLIDNEIMPVFDKYINAKPHKIISVKTLYQAWLQSYLALANALIFQGNNRCFEVLSTLFELFKKNEFDDKLFICKAKLALAFAYTIKGDKEASEKILEDVIKTYKTDIMDNEAISRWNLINILNNFMQKNYVGIKEELFQVVTFANNINDNFTKNILKTLLGKLFKDEESAKKALEIYSDQITYFSKEKNAIGALLTWYLIAEARLVAEGPEKSLEVSQKAIEVAQGSKINNYLFMVLFNKVIAEAFIVQAEYEIAKVHIEKAILIARKFEMLNFLADLYLLYGKYLQDIALVKTDAQYDYILGAAKMYKKAGLISQGINNAYLNTKIDKAKTVLNSFCQLNGITLKDV